MDQMKCLTPKDIMKRYHIKRNRAYELFNEISFPSFRVGKKLLVRQKDLIDWENSRKN